MKPINKLFNILIIITTLILSIMCWDMANAAEIHLQWDANPEPDIACYRIYMGTQIDMATWAWENVGEVAAPATEFAYDVPTDALRLFRVSACDGTGQESIRYNAGVFSCPNWIPPAEPSQAGIE